ncbi:MAG: hypothetical protein ACI381_01230 [Candidatus Methanomethylophilaceae archaeon]
MTAPRRSKKVTEVSEDAVLITSSTEPTPVSTSSTAPDSTSLTETIVIPDDPMTPTVTTPETVPSPQAGKDVLRRVLDVPKGKRAVPTLVSYRNVWTGEKRFLIIDVPEPVLRTAWSEWKAATGQTDPEVFIGDVCSVLDTDYPRLYRNVVPLDL